MLAGEPAVGMKPRSARTVALLDQHRAADHDACQRLSALTEVLQGRLIPNPAPNSTRVIVRKLVTRLVIDGLTFCQHLHPDKPEPVHWSPWAPGRFRCAPCHRTAAERFQGTTKVSKCDACGADHGQPLHALLVSTPPITVTASEGGDPWIVPSALITFSVCANCAVSDQEEQAI